MPKARTESPRKRGKRRIGMASGACFAMIAFSGTRPALRRLPWHHHPPAWSTSSTGCRSTPSRSWTAAQCAPVGATTPCIVGRAAGLACAWGTARGPLLPGRYLPTLAAELVQPAAFGDPCSVSRLTAAITSIAGNRLTPYLLGGLGGAIYGNEWRAASGAWRSALASAWSTR